MGHGRASGFTTTGMGMITGMGITMIILPATTINMIMMATVTMCTINKQSSFRRRRSASRRVGIVSTRRETQAPQSPHNQSPRPPR